MCLMMDPLQKIHSMLAAFQAVTGITGGFTVGKTPSQNYQQTNQGELRPSIILCSSSSIVSLIVRPLVSGKNTANNPQKMITIPNTPKERNFVLLPATAIAGATTPPSTNACLITASAEFLTHVGNSSTL
ncbi:hypothetical protein IEQ34_000959 [Dendrobium chrysotoxum]|uniref:Uncharacterized protein n=1 Tax=Dendrobium chrysotoxum TaxID=161865 RepID=A0AAV7HL68_DENCH|nr:hypothetical protein IEQ34_000959 [Dendrobium chrysotoxum]